MVYKPLQLFIALLMLINVYSSIIHDDSEASQHVLAPVIDTNEHYPGSSMIRAKRKIKMCFHSGNCPSRYSCIGFFCVFIGPSEIKTVHHDEPISSSSESEHNHS